MQRLDSVLLEEKEAFSGLEDQIERVVNKLREIAESSDDSSGRKEDADDTSSLANELTNFIDNIENHMKKFIIQVDKQHGSDRAALSGCFRNEMQTIESRLAETIHRRRRPSSSTVVKDGMEEKNSPVIKEGQASASSSSVSFESKYVNLSDDLQNCLMYCCIFPENCWIPKGKLIRLLVAEALIEEKPERVTEDIAEENIYELVSQEMLL
ncbi:hypothetical protein FNV43_RR20246 [Rhamnella rubrinervis]|uniref:Disease resistance protein winged helix domain-containing protein n=1 Tax=Rhamnella rubrinervis TaxID=2594499 RepID=A0A8K0E006_9ROSA|nr:hypothetical protein FNV43_RR20246 [Rhamnella rubrinervis]